MENENKEILLEVNNLKCYFNDDASFFKKNGKVVKAVDDVSFKIYKGEIYGLVGESGCGKSTTGRAILNLISKDDGSVTFDNKVIFDVSKNYNMGKKEIKDLRKDMQMIFQDPYSSLDPHMTVGNIIKMGLIKNKIVNNKDCEFEIKRLLEMCGLRSDDINKYPHEFSGGERQRIGIARALSLKPKFLVCDEPTSALDVSIQAQILILMNKLKNEMDLTYLFISHNLSLINYFCDRVGVMYLGKIVEEASCEDIFKSPIHPYTKCLISSIPKSHPSEKKSKIKLKEEYSNVYIEGKGCNFLLRCPYSTEDCKNMSPKLEEVTKGHFVSCHNYNTIY